MALPILAQQGSWVWWWWWWCRAGDLPGPGDGVQDALGQAHSCYSALTLHCSDLYLGPHVECVVHGHLCGCGPGWAAWAAREDGPGTEAQAGEGTTELMRGLSGLGLSIRAPTSQHTECLLESSAQTFVGPEGCGGSCHSEVRGLPRGPCLEWGQSCDGVMPKYKVQALWPCSEQRGPWCGRRSWVTYLSPWPASPSVPALPCGSPSVVRVCSVPVSPPASPRGRAAESLLLAWHLACRNSGLASCLVGRGARLGGVGLLEGS